MNQRTPTWLWAVPVFSCGILAAVPPFAIALKSQSTRAWSWCIGFATATALAFVLVGSQPAEADNAVTGLGGTIIILTLIASPIYSVMAGRQLSWGSSQPAHQHPGYYAPPPLPQDNNAAAIAAAQAVRNKRAEAREIVRTDPQMARDLRIGRPDLTRHYDDGGLVDINSAPEDTLTRWLGLTPADAALVVGTRDRLGRFQDPEDLVNLAGLDHGSYDACSHRIVLL